MNVTIDNELTCYGVHWNVPEQQARAQFEAWGFVGIRDFQVFERPINGNAARTKVMDIADRQAGDGVRYFWLGNYDWGVTADSAIYKFSYSAYTGDDRYTDDAARNSAAYVGKDDG